MRENKIEKGYKYLFFGDSIAFGQGVTICNTWVCRTAQYLKDNYPDKNFIINNPSINGNTTRMALERMPHDILDKKIDILVIEFGMNDCNYWETDHGVPRVSPDAFEANLNEIMQRAEAIGIKYIMLLTNHISGRNKEHMKYAGMTYQQNNENYNKIIRKVAASGRYLVDIEEAFKCEISKCIDKDARILDFLLPDLVHLSDIGHEYYFKFFIRELLILLKQMGVLDERD